MKKYRCDVCNFSTTSSVSLTRHKSARHSSARPFVCHICMSTFKISTILKRHIKNKHSVIKLSHATKNVDIPKAVNEKSLSAKPNSKSILIHVNETDHNELCIVECQKNKNDKLDIKQCSFCNFKTFYTTSLKDHLTSHCNKTLSCSLCPFTTKSPKTLSKHRLNHLPVKRYACYHCSYTTNDAQSLRKHSSRHSGIKTLQCTHCSYSTSDASNLARHKRNNCKNIKAGCRPRRKQKPEPKEYKVIEETVHQDCHELLNNNVANFSVPEVKPALPVAACAVITLESNNELTDEFVHYIDDKNLQYEDLVVNINSEVNFDFDFLDERSNSPCIDNVGGTSYKGGSEMNYSVFDVLEKESKICDNDRLEKESTKSRRFEMRENYDKECFAFHNSDITSSLISQQNVKLGVLANTQNSINNYLPTNEMNHTVCEHSESIKASLNYEKTYPSMLQEVPESYQNYTEIEVNANTVHNFLSGSKCVENFSNLQDNEMNSATARIYNTSTSEITPSNSNCSNLNTACNRDMIPLVPDCTDNIAQIEASNDENLSQLTDINCEYVPSLLVPSVFSEVPFVEKESSGTGCATECSSISLPMQLPSNINTSSDQKDSASSVSIKRSSLKKSTTAKTVFTCTVCGFRTHRKREYNFHCKTHWADKPFKCEKCSFKSKYKCSVVQHIKLKHMENELKNTFTELHNCDFCEFSTTHPSSLRRHMKRHQDIASVNEGSSYLCKFCSEEFSDRVSLLHHSSSHRNEKRYECKVCGYRTDLTMVLKKHVRNHLLKSQTEVNEDLLLKFTNLEARHKRDHKKKISCEHCAFTCAGRSTLLKHKSSVHPNKPCIVCKLCGTSLESRRALHEHQAALHRHDLPYACTTCGYRASHRYLLARHTKQHGKPAMVFSCTRCNFSARTKSSIVLHSRSHAGGCSEFVTVAEEKSGNNVEICETSVFDLEG